MCSCHAFHKVIQSRVAPSMPFHIYLQSSLKAVEAKNVIHLFEEGGALAIRYTIKHGLGLFSGVYYGAYGMSSAQHVRIETPVFVLQESDPTGVEILQLWCS